MSFILALFAGSGSSPTRARQSTTTIGTTKTNAARVQGVVPGYGADIRDGLVNQRCPWNRLLRRRGSNLGWRIGGFHAEHDQLHLFGSNLDLRA